MAMRCSMALRETRCARRCVPTALRQTQGDPSMNRLGPARGRTQRTHDTGGYTCGACGCTHLQEEAGALLNVITADEESARIGSPRPEPPIMWVWRRTAPQSRRRRHCRRTVVRPRLHQCKPIVAPLRAPASAPSISRPHHARHLSMSCTWAARRR